MSDHESVRQNLSKSTLTKGGWAWVRKEAPRGIGRPAESREAASWFRSRAIGRETAIDRQMVVASLTQPMKMFCLDTKMEYSLLDNLGPTLSTLVTK